MDLLSVIHGALALFLSVMMIVITEPITQPLIDLMTGPLKIASTLAVWLIYFYAAYMFVIMTLLSSERKANDGMKTQ